MVVGVVRSSGCGTFPLKRLCLKQFSTILSMQQGDVEIVKALSNFRSPQVPPKLQIQVVARAHSPLTRKLVESLLVDASV